MGCGRGPAMPQTHLGVHGVLISSVTCGNADGEDVGRVGHGPDDVMRNELACRGDMKSAYLPFSLRAAPIPTEFALTP